MKSVSQHDPVSGALVAILPTLRAAAASIPGAASGNICKACRGKQATAYGYRWAYHSKVSGSDTGRRANERY